MQARPLPSIGDGVVSQRDLRLRSKEIKNSVERGHAFTVSHDGYRDRLAPEDLPDERIGGAPLHSRDDDVNNGILPIGARFLAAIVRRELGSG